MFVKVVRERSDQRRHHRVTAPLFVEYDGHRIKATDWSLGGLRLDAFPGTLPELGATITLYLSIPFQGFDVRFDCDAEVVRRIEASKTLAVKYCRIGERELGLMEHFIDELIRGSMVDVKETIARIDVPVTPASTKPDANPLSKIPIGRWPTKTIAFAAMYLTIGLFVFGYAGVIAYTNFVRMEVDSAVIASPIESVRAQVNGRIIYGKYRQGDHVPKGALLLSVIDNDLERQIDLATIDIKDKSAQLSANERMLVEEMSRIDAFAKVEGKNVEQIDLEVQSLEAQAKAAQALHERLNHLYKQGFTTATLVENAEKQMISAQKLAQSKRVELQTRQSLATYNAGERLYNGQTFYGERAKIESLTFLAREHVAIAEKKLQALLDHRDRLAIYSPYPGVLQELPRPDGSMVRVSDILAVIENPKAREIWAFLRQDEVLSVGLGDDVKIYLPGLSELRKARVVRIDRTIGFVNEMNSTYIWRAPRDRSAKVILEFSDTGSKPQDESYRTGMPAVAIFSTRPTNYLVGDMMHRFKMVFGGRPRKLAEGAAATTTAGSRTRDKDAAEETPGTSNKDRLGPPRNYERANNPVRDLDAVTARHAAEVADAARPREPLAQDASGPAPAEPGLSGRMADSFAGLRERMRALLFSTDTAAVPAQPSADSNALPILVLPPKADPVPRPAPPPSRAAAAAPAIVPGSVPAPRVGAWPGSRPRTPAPSETALQVLPPTPVPLARTETPPVAGPAPHAVDPPARMPPPALSSPSIEAPGADDEPASAAAPPPKVPSPATPAVARGFFTRMAERLRAVFAVKPADDDDDWGDDPAVDAPPANDGLEGLKPSLPATGDGDNRRAPVLRQESPVPAAARRPSTARSPATAPSAAMDDTKHPAWQDRLRRTRTAERLP